ncbi:methyl-accepting chemotaxis protein [Clostridium saccharoperbutylacetonicum]|uniref:methyl-accepting chemotaxis protein n=1 Tax=Clostridium saccharoperbutylacetonicum TaxID=36745 RepID=UPI0039E9CC72
MRWYYNLKISVKLLIGFIIVALIAGLVGVIGITNIKKIQALDSEMYTRHTNTLDDLAIILKDYQAERVILRDLFILKDSTEKQKKLTQFNTIKDEIKISMANFEKGIKDDTVRENFNALDKALNDFYAYDEKEMNLLNSNQLEQATTDLYTEGISIANAVNTASDNLLKLKVELAKQSADNNEATANSTTTTMISIISLCTVISVILGIFISRIISKPVTKMAEAAEKLALGDVNVNIDFNSKDEIGSLAKSFTKMISTVREQAIAAEKIADGDLTTMVTVKSENDLLGKKLSEMIEKNNEILINIRNAAEQAALGAKQVSDSSIELSHGATEQASSIEELTASVEEISSQTKLNAENSNQANELAEAAKSNAVQGSLQMNEMLKAMEEINDASGNISKIIKVIDEIAFQTNILALNAAVEAARAGQHGKGFAVVAEEVRNLAARSAKAAKETTDMIESSIKKAEGGTRIAQDTADALSKIVNNIEKVANLVGDIAVASNEQASGISQINQGIIQVSQVVQANSATSEESAAASEELSSQAELLKEMVGKFNLKDNYKSYNSTNALNPEILKMLEEMAEKNNSKSTNENPRTKKTKIILSDTDFGKY